jgi:hypothetical protein
MLGNVMGGYEMPLKPSCGAGMSRRRNFKSVACFNEHTVLQDRQDVKD